MYPICSQQSIASGVRVPKDVLPLIKLCEQAATGDATARRKAQALELDAALGVLSGFGEGPDLVLTYKHLMVLEGNPEYALHLNPSDALNYAEWRG